MFIYLFFLIFIFLNPTTTQENSTFYINNTSICTDLCQGSETSPFPDLFYALDNIETNNFNSTTLIIILQNEYYLLTDILINPYLQKRPLNSYWPALSTFHDKNFILRSGIEKSIILVKTTRISFYIHSACNLSIENIFFYGNDLTLFQALYSYSIPIYNFMRCFSNNHSLTFCCGFDEFLDQTINPLVYNFDLLCKFDIKYTILQPDNPFSFIDLKNGSSLNIFNCGFINFHMYTFATMANVPSHPSNINITSSYFLNISVILYLFSLEQTSFTIQNTNFSNLFFNSSEKNSRIIIFNGSYINWLNTTVQNLSTTRISQTFIYLNLANSLLMEKSTIFAFNLTEINLIELFNFNNLFINACFVNEKIYNISNFWFEDDVNSINLFSVHIVLNYKNKLVLTNSQFIRFTFSGNSSNYFFISNSTFNYSYGHQIGFLYLLDSNIVVIKNCDFFYSAGTLFSGLASLMNSNILWIYNVSSVKCSSYLFGGCFYIESDNILMIKSSIFSDNIVNPKGSGGLMYINTNNTVSLSNCICNNSFNPMEGGVLSIYHNNDISILNSYFNLSQSSYHGGVMYIHSSNKIKIINSVFNNSQAIEEGGVIYLNSDNSFVFLNSWSDMSEASNEGGFLLCSDQNNVTIQSSNFTNSFTLRRGGFIYVVSENDLWISNSFFKNATTGEAGLYIYAEKNNNLYILFSVFQGSQLIQKGSVFYFDYANNVYFCLSRTYDNSNTGESIIYVNIRNKIKLNNRLFIEPLTDHKYILYADSFNFICWRNTSVLTLSIDYLVYFYQSNFVLLQQQNIKNFNCNINLIYIYLGFFIADKITMKYIKSNAVKLFDVQRSIIFINNSKFYFYDTPFILGNLNIGYLFISNSEFVRNSKIYEDFMITASQAIIYINQSYFYSCHFLFQNSVVFSYKSIYFNSKNIGNGGVFNIQILMGQNNLINSKNGFNTTFIRSRFILNSVQNDGGVIYYFIQDQSDINLTQINFNIKNSYFSNNRATLGSVLVLIRPPSVQIVNSVFINNSAFYKENKIGKGGCFFIGLMNSNSNFDSVINNSFINNRANIGGLIFIEGIPYFNLNNFSLHNIISLNQLNSEYIYYGEIIASSVKYLRFIEFDSKEKFLWVKNVLPGKFYFQCLANIFPFDYFENFAFNNDENILSNIIDDGFSNTSQITDLIEKNNLIEIHGYLCLTGSLSISSLSEINQNFTHIFHYEEFLQDYYYGDKSLTLNFTFTSCSLGQRLTDSLACEDCPRFLFSFNSVFEKTTTCQVCEPSYPFNCFGGLNITTKPGYWRSSKISTNFLSCPVFQNCLGDSRELNTDTPYLEYFSTGICNIGYIGPLCSVCDVGYGKVGGYTCAKCDSNSYYLQLFFFLFLSFIFVFYTIHKNLSMCISLYYKTIDIKDIMSTYLLKILINHCEVLFILLSLPLEWPGFTDYLKQFLDFFMQSSNGSSSWECLLKNIGIYMHIGYFNLIQVFALQILILLVSAFYLSFFLKIYKKIEMGNSASSLFKLNNRPKLSLMNNLSGITIFKTMKTIFLMIFSMNYTSLVKKILEMINSRDINDSINQTSDYRLILDYSIQYYSSLHQSILSYIVIPSMIIFLFFPILILLALLRRRGSKILYTKWSYFYYGYFFYAYQEKFFFWDFVIFMRRLILITLGVFFMNLSISYDSMVPMTSLLLVLLISLVMQIKFNPFNKNQLDSINIMEKISLLSLTLTLYLTIIYVMRKNPYSLYRYSYGDLSNMGNDSYLFSGIKQLLLALIIIINIAFFLSWMRFFAGTIDWKTIKRYLLKFSPRFLENSLKRVFNCFKKCRKYRNFVCITAPKLFRAKNFRINSKAIMKRFEETTSPTLESYLRKSKLIKIKILKKKIRNLKELLNMKCLQIKNIKKSNKEVVQENEKLKTLLKSIGDLKNTKTKDVNKIISENNKNNLNNEFITETLFPKSNFNFSESNETILQENKHFRISVKRPKKIFSFISKFYKFTIIFENINCPNLQKIKVLSEKSLSNFYLFL